MSAAPAEATNCPSASDTDNESKNSGDEDWIPPTSSETTRRKSKRNPKNEKERLRKRRESVRVYRKFTSLQKTAEKSPTTTTSHTQNQDQIQSFSTDVITQGLREFRARAYRNERLNVQWLLNSNPEEQERSLWLKREKVRIKSIKETVETTEARYKKYKDETLARRATLVPIRRLETPPTFCPICTQDFSSWPQLLEHIQTSHLHPDVCVSCTVCNTKFISELDLKDHVLLHARPLGIKANYHCTLETCGIVSVTKNLYGKHLRYHELRNEDLGMVPIFGWDCDYPDCFEIYPTKSKLLEHMYAKHGKIYECGSCDKHFAWAQHYVYHLGRVHGKDVPEGDRINCPYCYKSVEPDLWESHEMIHYVRPDEYKVELLEQQQGAESGKVSKTKSKHSGPLELLCTACGKPFTKKRSYLAHVTNKHPEIEEYQEEVKATIKNPRMICTVCGYFLSGAKDADSHMLRVHTYEHGTECYICSRRFKTLHNLIIHIRAVHKSDPSIVNLPSAKIQNFDCLYCDRSIQGNIYRNKHHYFAHQAEYLADKPHFCRVCYKNFETESERDLHFTKTHSKWACQLCNVVNISKISYDQHQKAHLNPSNRKLGHTQIPRKSQSERTNIYLVGNPRVPNPDAKSYPKKVGKKYLEGVMAYEKRRAAAVENVEALDKIQKQYICLKCPKQFNVSHQLSIHLQWHAGNISGSLHLVHTKKNSNFDSGIRTLSPEELEKYKNPQWDPKVTVAKITTKNLFPCPDCTQAFASPETLGHHLCFMHLGDFGPFEQGDTLPGTNEERQKYSCTFPGCILVYNSEQNLSKHCKMAHPELESEISEQTTRNSKSAKIVQSSNTNSSESHPMPNLPSTSAVNFESDPDENFYDSVTFTEDYFPEPEEFETKPIIDKDTFPITPDLKLQRVRIYRKFKKYLSKSPKILRTQALALPFAIIQTTRIQVQNQPLISIKPKSQPSKEEQALIRKLRNNITRLPENLRYQVRKLTKISYVKVIKVVEVDRREHENEATNGAVFIKTECLEVEPEEHESKLDNTNLEVENLQDPLHSSSRISRPRRKAAMKTQILESENENDSSPEMDEDEFQLPDTLETEIKPNQSNHSSDHSENEHCDTDFGISDAEHLETDTNSSKSKTNIKKKRRSKKSGKKLKCLFDYQCDLCAHKLSSRERYILHLQKIHSTYMPMKPFHTYHCLINGCQIGFPKVEDFLGHLVEKHDIVAPDQCSQCSKYFVSSNDLEQHQKLVHSKETFAPGFLEHAEEVHGISIPENCSQCTNIDFEATKAIFFDHLARDHGTRNLIKCSQCCKFLGTTKELQKSKALNCEYCCGTTDFKTSFTFKKHLNSHYIDPNLTQEKLLHVCSICGAVFRAKSGFNGHLVKYHGGEGGLIPGVKPRLRRYQTKFENPRAHQSRVDSACPICNTPARADSLYNHILTVHTYPNGLDCWICGDKYSTLQRLKLHLSGFHAQPVQLEPCKKRIQPKSNSRKQKCRFCDLICKDRFEKYKHCYDEHSTQYLAEAPHFCPICYRNYRTQQELDLHVVSHEKMKCGTCGVQYFRQDYFRVHLRSHTGDKPFNCRLCDKSFSTVFTLRDHERRHKNEFTVFCEVCGAGFYRNAFLVQHMEKAHGNTNTRIEGQESTTRKRRGRKPNNLNLKPKRSKQANPNPEELYSDSDDGEDYDAYPVPNHASSEPAYHQLQQLGLLNTYRF